MKNGPSYPYGFGCLGFRVCLCGEGVIMALPFAVWILVASAVAAFIGLNTTRV